MERANANQPGQDIRDSHNQMAQIIQQQQRPANPNAVNEEAKNQQTQLNQHHCGLEHSTVYATLYAEVMNLFRGFYPFDGSRLGQAPGGVSVAWWMKEFDMLAFMRYQSNKEPPLKKVVEADPQSYDQETQSINNTGFQVLFNTLMIDKSVKPEYNVGYYTEPCFTQGHKSVVLYIVIDDYIREKDIQQSGLLLAYQNSDMDRLNDKGSQINQVFRISTTREIAMAIAQMCESKIVAGNFLELSNSQQPLKAMAFIVDTFEEKCLQYKDPAFKPVILGKDRDEQLQLLIHESDVKDKYGNQIHWQKVNQNWELVEGSHLYQIIHERNPFDIEYGRFLLYRLLLFHYNGVKTIYDQIAVDKGQYTFVAPSLSIEEASYVVTLKPFTVGITQENSGFKELIDGTGDLTNKRLDVICDQYRFEFEFDRNGLIDRYSKVLATLKK